MLTTTHSKNVPTSLDKEVGLAYATIHLQVLEEAISNTIKLVEKSLVMVVGLRERAECRDALLNEPLISGLATGFALDRHVIVTAAHVLSDAVDICVVSLDGEMSKAQLLGLDDRWDVAFLHLDRTMDSLSTAIPKVGMLVLACGMAFGSLAPYYSLGIIGGTFASINMNGKIIEGLLKSDAVTVPGMSGGPLVNLRSEVVGMILACSRDAIAPAYAVPINRIEFSYRILKKYGRVIRPRIGIKVLSLHNRREDTHRGLIVIGVEKGSPADSCGIDVGDIIMSINGVELNSVEDLWNAIDESVIRGLSYIEITFYSRLQRKVNKCYIHLTL
ncbi:MAG TPA: PDZ domain-containing protein [Ignisphaera sp.]|nr:PDZ domain-containing protein [Ignisphaera sp.]